MSKFPINLVLYLAIVLLLGGSGWQFYLTYTAPKSPDGNRVLKQLDEKLKDGQRRQPPSKGTDYSNMGLLSKFRDANFTGKEPPKAEVVRSVDPGPEVKTVNQTPLEDILYIRLVYFDGDKSRIIIQYNDTANIEPPEEIRLAMQRQASAAAVRPPVPGKPRGGRKSRATPLAMPTVNPASGFRQLMLLEDTLWKPYDHIRLAHVAADAGHAVFVREDPQKDKADWSTDKLYKDELGLDQQVIAALHAARIGTAGMRPVEPRDADSNSAVASAWKPTRTTRKVGRDEWHIGSDDRELFGREAQRVFNEDIGLQSYRGKRYRGVRISKISKRYASYGINEGDIIVSINSKAVTSKAEAIKIGKGLYKKGVRSFQVVFLSRGQRVIRNYIAPDK